MSSSLYSNAAALSGLVIWYGVFVLLDRPIGGGTSCSPVPEGIRMIPLLGRWRWFRPLLPLLAGFLCFRVLGWYLGAVYPSVAPHLEHLAGGSRLVLFIVDVGLREEFLKLLFALPCLLWVQRSTARPSALLTAAMVGLGFATAENRWFFAGHGEPTLLVGRVFATTALHAACTGLCGAALMQAWHSRPQIWGRCMAVFLTVATAHGLYDWAPVGAGTWLQAGGTSWLSQMVIIALMSWFFIRCRYTQPEGAQARGAALWFGLSATAQYALTLGLTWGHWQTGEAVWVCARECFFFLPATLCTAVFLVTVSPHSAGD